MKFGLLLNTTDPTRSRLVERWREVLDMACVAEASGFDGVFVPEHHMMDDGFLPSPWAALGALAARTSRIEIGTSVHLLPLDHPIHVAEHAAMVDVLSNGRLRLGCGLGNFPAEYDLFGIDSATQGSRLEEALELLQHAWCGTAISHAGDHFQVRGTVRPQPVGAEIWIGAMSQAGVRRAARFGCRWITDPLHSYDVIAQWDKCYRAAGIQHSTSESLGVTTIRAGWISDSLSDAERIWWPSVQERHWFYFRTIPRWSANLEPTFGGVKDKRDLRFDIHREERFIVGSRRDCILSIESLLEKVSTDYLVMSFSVPGGPGHADELQCVKRFAREVIPYFR